MELAAPLLQRTQQEDVLVLDRFVLEWPTSAGKPGKGKVNSDHDVRLPGSAPERGRAKDERNTDREDDDARVKPEPGTGVVGGDPR
jgi:hypothetical protein